MTDKAARIHIETRWMVSPDLPAILSIEKESFPAPWVEDDFRALLSKRNVIGIVAYQNPLALNDDQEENEEPIGYALYELHDTYLELLTLAVSPEFRNKEVGQQLVKRLQVKLSAVKSRRRIEMRVPEECLALQILLRKCGFLATSIRHFAGSTHFGSTDKYVMEWFKPERSPSYHTIELDEEFN